MLCPRPVLSHPSSSFSRLAFNKHGAGPSFRYPTAASLVSRRPSPLPFTRPVSSLFAPPQPPTEPTRFLRLSGVPKTARRKDLTDALAGLTFDPKRLFAKYNINYIKLEDWFVEMATLEEAAKALQKRLNVADKPVKASPITEDLYNQERDRIVGFDGGKVVLFSQMALDTDSNDIRRALLGWNVLNITFVKDERGKPSGRVIVHFESEAEAHRAVLEKHRRIVRNRMIECQILH